jgi:RNA polymerase sigma-70 factor (ECF subfamily)
MIERLSGEYRQAVILVDLEGIAQQEAAAQLGLSLSGMKSRVQRGRRQLKGMLEDCCTIELDRRHGVVDFDLRNQQDNSCRDRPGC